MKRREFLAGSGSTILIGSSLNSWYNRPAIGTSVEISGKNINRSPSEISSVHISFDTLEIIPLYISEKKQY
jgi:hypothetical protein